MFVVVLFFFVVKDFNNFWYIEFDVDCLKKYSVYYIDRNSSCYFGKCCDLLNVLDKWGKIVYFFYNYIYFYFVFIEFVGVVFY